jgi:hypothetical protein
LIAQTSKKKICKKYKVTTYNFTHNWLNKKDKIFAACESVRRGQLGKRKRVRGGGRHPKFVEFEKALWTWFHTEKVGLFQCVCRQPFMSVLQFVKKHRVSYNAVWRHARNTCAPFGIRANQLSYKWFTGFRRRHKVC